MGLAAARLDVDRTPTARGVREREKKKRRAAPTRGWWWRLPCFPLLSPAPGHKGAVSFHSSFGAECDAAGRHKPSKHVCIYTTICACMPLFFCLRSRTHVCGLPRRLSTCHASAKRRAAFLGQMRAHVGTVRPLVVRLYDCTKPPPHDGGAGCVLVYTFQTHCKRFTSCCCCFLLLRRRFLWALRRNRCTRQALLLLLGD